MTHPTPAEPPKKKVTRGTDRHAFRYPNTKWERLVEIAEPNAAKVLQAFCDWYIGEPKAKMPRRPKNEEQQP